MSSGADVRRDERQRWLAAWRHFAVAPGRTLGALQRGRGSDYLVVTAAAALGTVDLDAEARQARADDAARRAERKTRWARLAPG